MLPTTAPPTPPAAAPTAAPSQVPLANPPMIAPPAAPMPAPFSVWLHAVSVKQTSTPEMIFFMSVLSIHRRYGRLSTVEAHQGGDVWPPKITRKLRRAVGIDTSLKREFA
ncbi:MAG: hypothetical protein ACT6RN_15650 [Agrobacterium sp.]|uniref:hypothetical protein n=1 Tax=Agrobacterium sp. TaxID=361 RepID=UPI00403765A2